MDSLFLPADWSKLHHSTVILGAAAERVWEELEKNLQFKRRGNPDAFSASYESFGIEEARALSEWAIMKPVAGTRKAAVIEIFSFTNEAQNALLKLFEEPPEATYFFVVAPNNISLLPTLLSRSRTIYLNTSANLESSTDSFAAMDVAGRLKLAARIAKSKDTQKALQLIEGLEREVNNGINSFTDRRAILNSVLNARRLIASRGSSTKLILEHLAISL